MNLEFVPKKLQEFFAVNNKIALAFSGGVDSAYLLYAGVACGADIKAYYVNSQFQPTFEMNHAVELKDQLGAEMEILPLDVLQFGEVIANPSNRCYYCKNGIFSTLINASRNDGYTVLIDGTNASDDSGDRPGMKALQELKVLSPLRECGITKSEIRDLSKKANLFTWNKPSYACLATRVATGQEITADILTKVESSEDFLFSLGFSDFRVRVSGDSAKIQLPENLFDKFIMERENIYSCLSKNFKSVVLDLQSRVGVD